MSSRSGGSAARSSAAARRSVAGLLSQALVSATRAGSCGMEQPSLAEHGSWQRGPEAGSGEEPTMCANEGVHCRPCPPQNLVGKSALPTIRCGIVGNDDQKIVIAVGVCVAARDGAEEVDALGLIGRHESLDDEGKSGIAFEDRVRHRLTSNWWLENGWSIRGHSTQCVCVFTRIRGPRASYSEERPRRIFWSSSATTDMTRP